MRDLCLPCLQNTVNFTVEEPSLKVQLSCFGIDYHSRLPATLFDGGDEMVVTVTVWHSENSTSSANNISFNLNLPHLSSSGGIEALSCNYPVSSSAWIGQHLVLAYSELNLDEMIICNYSAPLSKSVRSGTVRWEVDIAYFSDESGGTSYAESDTHDIPIVPLIIDDVFLSTLESVDGTPYSPKDVQNTFATAGLGVANNQILGQLIRLSPPQISFGLSFLVQLSSPSISIAYVDSDLSVGPAVTTDGSVTATRVTDGVIRLNFGDVAVAPDFSNKAKEVNASFSFRIAGEDSAGFAIEYVVLLDDGLSSVSNLTFSQNVTIVSPRLVLKAVEVGGQNVDAGDIISIELQTAHHSLSNSPAVNMSLRLSPVPKVVDAVNNTSTQYVDDILLDTAVSLHGIDDDVYLFLLMNSTWIFNVSLRVTDDVRPGENITLQVFLVYTDAGMYV